MDESRYQFIAKIKESSKGTIELVHEEGELLVIKRMKDKNNGEVYKALSAIQNVHIPKVYEWEQSDKELIVVEEYVDGETLQYHIENGTLSEEQKLSVALQLCEAVEDLHRCEPPIIHRDIKPSNILITREGIVKLIDFDASREYKFESDSGDTRILGTVEYAAPEQYGFTQTDTRSDIYSMGVVFNRLDVRASFPVSAVWKKVVDVCTGFDPQKRYKSVGALKQKICHVLFLRKRLRFCVVGALILLLLFGTGVFVCMKMWKPAQESEKATVQGDLTAEEVTAGESEKTENNPAGNEPSAGEIVEDFTEEDPAEEELVEKEPVENEPTGGGQEPSQTVEEDATEDELAAIAAELKSQSIHIYDYYKGDYGSGDLLSYSTALELGETVLGAYFQDLVSGAYVIIPPEYYRFEHSIFCVDEEFMQNLRGSCYRLRVTFSSKGERTIGEEHFWRVCPEESPFEQHGLSLMNDVLDYCYKDSEILHLVLTSDTKAKISGVYLPYIDKVPEEQYKILYDGRALELSKEMLEICRDQVKVCFWVGFEDGRKEILTIENPYLR